MQLARLAGDGRLTETISGLAKLNNTRKARHVIAEARDLLGGNGILLENHVIRHMTDIEILHTYEGAETIQTLIVGRDITGKSAFVRTCLPSASMCATPKRVAWSWMGENLDQER
jgi:glutaryl-CoA dehydrogenase